MPLEPRMPVPCATHSFYPHGMTQRHRDSPGCLQRGPIQLESARGAARRQAAVADDQIELRAKRNQLFPRQHLG